MSTYAHVTVTVVADGVTTTYDIPKATEVVVHRDWLGRVLHARVSTDVPFGQIHEVRESGP
jgi:hypothetical protein